MNKEVSIVVVTYNQKNYIEAAIKSALAQNKELIKEIIIVDDSSNDGTSSIIDEIKNDYPIIRYIRNSENLGAYQTVRYAHSLASGKYIAHLDGDDIWEADKIDRQYAELCENKSLVACGALARVILQNGTIAGSTIPVKYIAFPSGADIIANHPCFIFSSLIYRRDLEIWSHIPSGDALDWTVFVALRFAGPIKVLDSILANYRLGVGISSSTNLFLKEVDTLNFAYRTFGTSLRLILTAAYSISAAIIREKNWNARTILKKTELFEFYIPATLVFVLIVARISKKIVK